MRTLAGLLVPIPAVVGAALLMLGGSVGPAQAAQCPRAATGAVPHKCQAGQKVARAAPVSGRVAPTKVRDTRPKAGTRPTPGGRSEAVNVWSTNAFSTNVWSHGKRAQLRPATLLGRAATVPQLRRAPVHREPEAIDRWDAAEDCLVVGDSIAVGVAQARPDCNARARSGISSGAYSVELLRPARARTVVISLGVNDDASVDTVANLRTVRTAIDGQKVFWLLPGIRERARTAIRTVAAEFGDRLIDTRAEAGRDHLHPTGAGYEVIATRILGRPAS